MAPPDHRDQSKATVKPGPSRRRRLLRVSVKTALLAAMAAFAGVFVYGMFMPGGVSDDVISVRGMPQATARLVSWNGRPVWVVRRSPEQLAGLEALSAFVSRTGDKGPSELDRRYRSLAGHYGIYLAETGRAGILVQYTRQRPAGLDPETPWLGGFVDPANKAVFDPAGRRYRGTHGGPLVVPPHRWAEDGTLRLGDW